MSFWEYIVYTQIYNDMISNGVYYLNERGIQLEYYPNICKRNVFGRKLSLLKRRTILNDVREGRQASECEIFLFVKRCTEKKRR